MTDYADLTGLHTTVVGGVARVVIDHPPINLFDLTLMTGMDTLGRRLEADDEVRVVVIESADPDFFIAHADVQLILQLPGDQDPDPSSELNFFHALVDRFRTMPKATIAKIRGIARGGGAEFLSSLDMRFGAVESTVLGQPEVALGIIPGGSGTQRLPRLLGRGRALEVVFPPRAVAEAKASVLRAEPDPMPGLVAEGHAFSRTLTDPAAIDAMERFLERGGQTRAAEVNGLDVLLEPM